MEQKTLTIRINVQIQDKGAGYREPQGDSSIQFDVTSAIDAENIAQSVAQSLIRVALADKLNEEQKAKSKEND